MERQMRNEEDMILTRLSTLRHAFPRLIKRIPGLSPLYHETRQLIFPAEYYFQESINSQKQLISKEPKFYER